MYWKDQYLRIDPENVVSPRYDLAVDTYFERGSRNIKDSFYYQPTGEKPKDLT